MNCPTGSPSTVRRAFPDARPAGEFRQRAGRPCRQRSQAPQKTDRQVMTRSPGRTYSTELPTASTTPADSCPATAGTG